MIKNLSAQLFEETAESLKKNNLENCYPFFKSSSSVGMNVLETDIQRQDREVRKCPETDRLLVLVFSQDSLTSGKTYSRLIYA